MLFCDTYLGILRDTKERGKNTTKSPQRQMISLTGSLPPPRLIIRQHKSIQQTVLYMDKQFMSMVLAGVTDKDT